MLYAVCYAHLIKFLSAYPPQALWSPSLLAGIAKGFLVMNNAGLSELLQSVAHSDPAAKDLIDMICGEGDALDEFDELAGMEIEEQLKVLSEPSDLPKADVEVMVDM